MVRASPRLTRLRVGTRDLPVATARTLPRTRPSSRPTRPVPRPTRRSHLPSGAARSAPRRSASTTSVATRTSPSSRRTACCARRVTSGFASGRTRRTARSRGTRTARAVSRNASKCSRCLVRVALPHSERVCLLPNSTKTARPVDDRNAMFTSDPNIKRFDSERVLCRICEKWVSIVSENNAAAVKMWMQHRSACQPASSPGPGSSTSK